MALMQPADGCPQDVGAMAGFDRPKVVSAASLVSGSLSFSVVRISPSLYMFRFLRANANPDMRIFACLCLCFWPR